ncbi:alpha/beta hydrolase [Phyllobacterium brassicacearum]|uniref:Alpha/beta hydrolase n=1 Tax=Phyllobacterium brassicacearum TaxID=314235 RepID=A0A2P7ATW1_9HYPH|nr:alpha/beta fold hydrolase [Phyllobacterium brassicacearum]PSH57646.1 alpha/beta hydrolase [Phyllobacterium brassicacearum]TDQ07316.1 pimeloyl-ACP methyl ester carboxylesterase [Phyllobacterium brassicacearum]
MTVTQRQIDERNQSKENHGRPNAGLVAREHLLAKLPVSERRLQIARVSTAVLDGGDGQPVILLHGPGGYAAHWMRIIPELATTHHVIAPDLPGHGASEVTDGSLDAEDVLIWLGEFIDQTCKSKPVLIGELMGGAIAARYACRHSDLLDALVLVDSFGLTPFQPSVAFGEALTRYQVNPAEHTHEDLWRYCAHDLDELRQRMGELWDPFETYNLDRARSPALHAALATLMRDFIMPAIPAAELRRIKVPVTLIWGRCDLATPLDVAETAAARYGWPLHVIEDANDAPAMEQPERFLTALRTALYHSQIVR